MNIQSKKWYNKMHRQAGTLVMNKKTATKDSNSFYITLLRSFLITSVTSVLLLTFFLSFNYLNSIASSTKYYSQQLLSQMNYAIDKVDENVNNLAVSLINNNSVTAFLSLWDNDGTIPVLAGRELDNQLMVLPYVDSIYLYNAKLDLMYSSKTGYQVPLDEFEDMETTERLMEPGFLSSYAGTPIPAHKSSADGSAEILSYYFPNSYINSKEKTNAIIINIHVSSLTDSISSMKELSAKTESDFVLFESKGTYLTGVFHSGLVPDSSDLSIAVNELSSSAINSFALTKINKKQYFQISTDSNLYNWRLINYIPADIMLHDILLSAFISFLIMAGFLVLIYIVCVHVARRLNQPVETLSHLLTGTQDSIKASSVRTKEFQTILSSVSSLMENNQKLRSMQQQSKYSLIQSCLNNLVTNQSAEPPSSLLKRLESLDLSYLNQNKLCMAVFKIDNYHQVLSKYASDELWALRFSVVNILEELVSASYTCRAFSRDDDKIVLLAALDSPKDSSEFRDRLTNIFESTQENIKNYLHITVTAAYSTVFQGIDEFPAVYKYLENALLWKMKYGHGSIIDPAQAEETTVDTFRLSYRLTAQLIDRLSDGSKDEAWSSYEALTNGLFNCEYNEILSVMIHLIHSVYERLLEKFPIWKDSITTDLKNFLSGLEIAEVGSDIDDLARLFFENICSYAQKLKDDPAQQNSAIVTDKIVQLVNQNYSDPAICLCSIAEDVGLSPNYTGHIFKQNMQKSVAQYILEVRMEKLTQYLQTTSLPLNKILDKVGLEKNNYFYTRFKNYFGMSLGEYRQKFQLSSNDSQQL